MLKYQKFQTPISKRDILSKKGSNVMNYAEVKWKASKFVIILLWEVIYAYFYNWDRLLDFISGLYDLIELIIEVSL